MYILIFYLQDFLVQLEAKKTRVVSINLTSREVVDVTTEEGRRLKERLKVMNRRWEAVCAQATRVQSDLQEALMQCQEFHHTIHNFLLWLEGLETRIQQCEPINLGNDEAALWTRLRKLQVFIWNIWVLSDREQWSPKWIQFAF